MRVMVRIIVVAALLVAAISAHAAPPVVTSVYPVRQRIDAGSHTIVEVHFDQAIDPASVTPITFRVYGRWSGPASGTLTVVGGTITFTPTDPFFAGEWITVNVSKGVTNTGAEHLAKGYSWNFWIKTAAGSLVMTYDTRINCRVSPETWVQVYGAYAGDLNNDGWSDLTAPCEQTSDARVFLNNNGTFAGPPQKVSLVNGAISSPNEGADFDNDGNIDLVIGNTGGDKASLIFGDGTGNFPAGRKTSVTCASTIRGVGVGDFNGDGWDDFVTANRFGPTSGNLSIVLNNGDGTFAPAVAKNTGGAGEYTIAIADANNDGIPDIFCGTFDPTAVIIVLLGNGSGDFTAQPAVAEGGKPWQTVVGDFNKDGNVDVASCNSNTNNIGIFFGNGSGGFLSSTVTLVGCDLFPLAIDAGDIDGDGDLELVTSCYTAAKWDIFQNTAGVFGNKKTLAASQAGSCVVLHDRDNDGDLDLTGLDEVDDWVYFYENTGTATGISTPSTSATVLLQNHPNPFNPTTSIRYELRHDADVTLSVYDATGAYVSTLVAGTQTHGSHDVAWNGTDAKGTRVGSGIYFYRLVSQGTTLTRKMVLLK